MIINDIMINASCEDILDELQKQLIINQVPLLQKMKDSGDNIMVQCPYHGNGQERKPSAGIRKSDGVLHCFACGATHTLPEMISYCLGHTEDVFGKQGFKWIMKNFATVQVEDRKDVEIDMERNHTTNKNSLLGSSSDNKLNRISEEELDSYRYYHQYWKKRGITDEDIIELFDLGYDVKTDCITFPVRDINGNCLFVARRNVKTKWFNYPAGAEKPLYGLYEINVNIKHRSELLKSEYVNPLEIFVCESMIDCILLCQAGYWAVALNGLGNELQFKQLRELPTRKLILATDNDTAGQNARERIRKNITNKLITEIMFPTNRKDIGECTQEEIKNIHEWEVW